MRSPRILVLAALVVVATAPRALAQTPAETPNRAMSVTVPAGWTVTPITSGLELQPPRAAGKKDALPDESVVIACEPFALASVDDGPHLEDLLGRLRAGQLVGVDEARRPPRERVVVNGLQALVVRYEGQDDSGLPATLEIAVVPSEGRVGLLTARVPTRRLAARAKDLDAILASMTIRPAAEEKALRARLVGEWRSEAAPGVALTLRENGVFEEARQPPIPQGKKIAPEPAVAAGTWVVVGREVRLRFEDRPARAFLVDEEPASGRFRSGGQLWTRG